MSTPRIMDLVDAACAAALDEAAASSRAASLKAAAVAEAERIRIEVGSADRFTSEQALGVLRLDGANKPAVPRVEKPAELADYLAQRQPHLVQASITVPADRLEEALHALNFAGIGLVSAEVKPTTDAQTWVQDNCHPTADPDVPGGWYVRAITADGTSETVPGVGASRPTPRWVLAANPDLKRARAQAAEDEARAEVHPPGDGPQDLPPNVTGHASTPAAPDPLVPLVLRPDWAGRIDDMTRDELVAQCRSAGAAISGTKAVLAARLKGALGG